MYIDENVYLARIKYTKIIPIADYFTTLVLSLALRAPRSARLAQLA